MYLHINKSIHLFRCPGLKFRLAGIIVLLLLSSARLRAQTSLFSYISDASSALSSLQKERLDSLRRNPLYNSITMIEMMEIATVQNDGDIAVIFPDGTTDMCRAIRVYNPDMSNTPTELDWEGVFYNEDDSSSDGNMQLGIHNGEVFGSISRKDVDELYEILSFGPGVNALAKINMLTLSSYTCGADSVEDNGTSEKEAAGLPCPTKVRILYCYTQAAKKSVANIHNTVALSLNHLIGGWMASDDLSNLSFELAGVYELAETDLNEDMVTSAYDLTSLLAANTVVQLQRNNFKADMVVCLTNHNYLNQNGTLAVGQSLRVGDPDNASMYSIVKASAATVNYTLPHEIGHMMGGRHQQQSLHNADHDNTLGRPHGYNMTRSGFLIKPVTYYDMMHAALQFDGVSSASIVRSHLYSTPNAKIWNIPMGLEDDNNVTAEMKANACTVAAFRSDTFNFFEANMTAPSIVVAGNTVTVSGTGLYGVAPYTFDWYISNDGFSYTSIGTGATKTFTMLAPQTIVWMKATTAASEQRIVTKTILSPTAANQGAPVANPFSRTVKAIDEEMNIKIYPNPSTSVVNISIAPNMPDGIEGKKIEIIDMTGRATEIANIKSSTTNYSIDTRHLAKGVYIISVGGKKMANVKFTIL